MGECGTDVAKEAADAIILDSRCEIVCVCASTCARACLSCAMRVRVHVRVHVRVCACMRACAFVFTYACARVRLRERVHVTHLTYGVFYLLTRLATIYLGICESRRMFANLSKAVGFYLACKTALVLLFVSATLSFAGLPLAPIQVLCSYKQTATSQG